MIVGYARVSTQDQQLELKRLRFNNMGKDVCETLGISRSNLYLLQ
jgi:DNA invertase Pin-like site-specific DNA recombinase